MASNGLLNRAKTGTCRICYRRRCTLEHVRVVGEVRHGFATGHIWECKNRTECINKAKQRIVENHSKVQLISIALNKYT